MNRTGVAVWGDEEYDQPWNYDYEKENTTTSYETPRPPDGKSWVEASE